MSKNTIEGDTPLEALLGQTQATCMHEELEGIGNTYDLGGKRLEWVNCTACQGTYIMKWDLRFPSYDAYLMVRWHRDDEGKLLFTYQRKP